jgi:hypothetical protein
MAVKGFGQQIDSVGTLMANRLRSLSDIPRPSHGYASPAAVQCPDRIVQPIQEFGNAGHEAVMGLPKAQSCGKLQTIKFARATIPFDFGVLRCQNCCGDATFIHSYWLA